MGRRSFVRAALLATLSLTAAPVWAKSFDGLVVGVADGDTLTVLDATQHTHRIRLAGIDAPERRQAFGDRSTRVLSDLVFGKTVSIEFEKVDRFGRIVGKVRLGEVDAGLEMVRAGFAWHFKKYADEQAPADRAAYDSAEQDARRRRDGVWKDADAIAPWEFRRLRR
jgi:endonuclease YncB( thermonuclease family)